MKESLPQADVPAPPPFAAVALPADLFGRLDAIGMSPSHRIVYLRMLFEARHGFVEDGCETGRPEKIESLRRRGFIVRGERWIDGSIRLGGFEIPLLTRGVLR